MSSTSNPAGRHLSFPFRIGADGRTAAPSTHEEHVRDELVQLILTGPGERPFLPEFGGGARQLIFEPTEGTFRFREGERVTGARGAGVVRAGYASGALVQYEVERPGGARYMAREAELRRP